MLISGKSGTMLPMTACSSTGQFDHDGSCGWQRRIAPSRTALQRNQHRAAPAFHDAEARPLRAGRRHRDAHVAGEVSRRDVRCDQAYEPQRFVELVEADRDARGDVALVGPGLAHAELGRTERSGKSQRKSKRLAARAPGEAGQAELARELRRSRARTRGTDPAVRRARRRCRAAFGSRAASAIALLGDARRASSSSAGRARRRPARRSPSAGDGRTRRGSVRSTSSLRRENCARPNAKPPSLPR